MASKHARLLPVFALLAAAAAGALAADGTSVSTTTTSSSAVLERRDILYYSDLGTDRIDVSAYPEEQRRNYVVYTRACSRCHSLARSLNAPLTSRGWWEFYMTGMRLRGRAAGRPFSREEVKAVLDFLEYDSRVRKVEHADAFETSTVELKRRFNEYVDRRMSELQKKMPKIAPYSAP
jgi:hypothetical protein